MSRRLLGWSALIIVVALVTILTVLLTRSNTHDLDPDNARSGGAQAVARVLSQQGVDVRPVRSRSALDAAADRPDTTVVVTRPELLSPATLRDVVSAPVDRVVLIEPDAYVVHRLDLPVLAEEAPSTEGDISGSCSVKLLSGLRLDGFDYSYEPVSSTEPPGCFTPAESPGQVLVQLPRTSSTPQVVLLGSADVLRNDTVLQGDNSAIALRLLGQDKHLVWFAASPSTQEAAAGAPSVWPHWIRPTVIVVGVAVLLLALWRGRRLGRLVPEPLPVVVPANEITRSRGQLYRKARSTGRAATILRQATRARLAAYLGLPSGCSQQSLVEEVARAGGRDPLEVDRLLFGPMPEDERSMTSIAQDLSTIERQVRT